MERNGIAPDDAVYIGDTLGDSIATRKAGIKFVLADYGFGEVEDPDWRIESIDELLSLF